MRSNRAARRYPNPLLAVAIPAHNEVERIVRCVDALNAQQDTSGTPLAKDLMRVVVLANSCTDGTYAALVERLDRWQVAITVIDIHLPRALCNAGSARYLANHAALDLLPADDGLLFMTDADSCAPPHWISTYAQMLQSGYDAVIGSVDFHPDDCSEIPPPLQHRCVLEDRYASLLDELESRIDPLRHDPWPRHFSASGANIALRVDALQRIGDFPRIALGEDKALARALVARDCRVRHDCQTRVHTSGRLFGRAAGGMADTLRHRFKVPGSVCDERLESAEQALWRASVRRALRDTFSDGTPSKEAIADVMARFGMETAGLAAGNFCFEAFWDALERHHPRLIRHPITPCRLMAEIRHAERLLEEVRDQAWSFALPCNEEQWA
jgi:hypothetical protein